jgi:hypothetical protein
MNPSPEIGMPPTRPNVGTKPSQKDQAPANWREAIMSLIASRIALIQLESKGAGKEAAKRASLIGGAVGCLFFTWALLLAGGVVAIAEATNYPWHWIAMGAALLHRLARPSGKPAFPITRAEFQKDREWIETFQTTKKSND